MELHIPTQIAIVSIPIILFTCISSSSSSLSSSLSPSNLHPLVVDSVLEHLNYTAISEFRLLNRRRILECSDGNPYLKINVSGNATMGDEDVSYCPLNKIMYVQTGDLIDLPLLCHYPIKAQYLSRDPDYLSCKKECKEYKDSQCVLTTCGSTLTFHVLNIRTDIEFVLFAGGFTIPCVLKRSNSLTFANPNQPLYGHLSSIDSTGTSMKITWASGGKEPQEGQYGDVMDLICLMDATPSQLLSQNDPVYIHNHVDSAGWKLCGWYKVSPSNSSPFPSRAVASMLRSMLLAPTPRSVSVAKAVSGDVDSGNLDAIFHVGDISYAPGFLVEWNFFLHSSALLLPEFPTCLQSEAMKGNYLGLICVPSMGNAALPIGHCMPTPAKYKPWYSIEQASVHFTVISTKHDWSENLDQYQWMRGNMAQPVYISGSEGGADRRFLDAIEPLLLDNKADLVLFGHVPNYERTCSVYQNQCKAVPKKDQSGVDSAPVQVVIGMAGFGLDDFLDEIRPSDWSLIRISKFGYFTGHATPEELQLEYVNAGTRKVEDIFRNTR
ncbi:hypothetical protein ACJRO7_004137 [Eucalyptus globulus]|uniref:Purple acid phosphatase Fn3-like domain-containing protein n=1 Tax=Eucalyptus globulus TaxID=34317 RepID=A0ABD3IZ21_EUCGL